jgi:hypothetical protein
MAGELAIQSKQLTTWQKTKIATSAIFRFRRPLVEISARRIQEGCATEKDINRLVKRASPAQAYEVLMHLHKQSTQRSYGSTEEIFPTLERVKIEHEQPMQKPGECEYSSEINQTQEALAKRFIKAIKRKDLIAFVLPTIALFGSIACTIWIGASFKIPEDLIFNKNRLLFVSTTYVLLLISSLKLIHWKPQLKKDRYSEINKLIRSNNISTDTRCKLFELVENSKR